MTLGELAEEEGGVTVNEAVREVKDADEAVGIAHSRAVEKHRAWEEAQKECDIADRRYRQALRALEIAVTGRACATVFPNYIGEPVLS